MAFHHSLFTYHPETRRFVAEASDLQMTGWSDRIAVQGRTGIETFSNPEAIMDQDGDLMVVIYSNTKLDVEVHILND